MAFTIPNTLRQLVAEGAVNTALVPILTDYHTRKDKDGFLYFTNVLFNLFLVALLVITVIGILVTPLLIRIIAPGFITDPAKFNLTVELTKILFPYILLVGLTAYCIGVLNTFRHFAAPAFASAAWNATLIVAMLIFYRSFEITYLAFAVLAGGVFQLLLQVIPMLKRGPFFNVRAGLLHEGAKRVGRLLLPRMVGAGIYHINIIVDRILASLQFIVGNGAVAALYYGHRLFHLPLALFSIAIATAALPTMSLFVIEKNMDKLKESISFSIRNMLFLSMPASIGLMVMARPIIKVIFERGEFTAYATDITSFVLFFYAIGLIAYGGIKILVTTFHAMQDTLTPVKAAFLALLVNIILNLVLMIPLKAGGLALATSISGFVNFTFLFVVLEKRIGLFGRTEIIYSFIKMLLASFVMGFIAYISVVMTTWGGGMKDIISLVLIILVSIAVYFAMAAILKIGELKAMLSWIKKS
jgi:putative peptidoglycan lipid II flippase